VTIPEFGAGVGYGRPMATYEGYCVKCREKREFDGEVKEMANGRRAAQGTCPVCGTKMNRMLGKEG
jgi:predicted nucleic acid-binding Zn ribbon protein